MRLVGFVLAVLVASVVTHPRLRAQPSEPPHVVLISIDGLKPSTYTRPEPYRVPTLRRLAHAGVYAEGVVGVEPTVTYPSHTTIVTGVPPAVHGITNNRIFDPEEASNGAWYWYARDVRVPTVYQAVKSRGLATAAVSWPATVDADIDYLVPEFGGVSRHPKSLDLIRALAHPRGLLDAFERAVRPLAWPQTDADRTELAAWIFRTYRPNLMLLHLEDTDSTQHYDGPESADALVDIEQADANVERVLDAVAAAGLRDRTDVVIVSDHGFMPVTQQLQLNFAFKQAGLLEVNGSGRVVRWDAYYYGAGGSGFVLLKNPDDAALRARVSAIVQAIAADPAHGIQTVWTRDDLRRMGAEPRASFGIDMRDGFSTGGGNDVLMRATADKGGHGFSPGRPALHASLIMAGPDVRAAGSLGIVRMTQIAPTVASWFGAALSAQADTPLRLMPIHGVGHRQH